MTRILRRIQRDLSSVLMGPVRTRLAAPHRLPYLPSPARVLAASAREAQAVSA